MNNEQYNAYEVKAFHIQTGMVLLHRLASGQWGTRVSFAMQAVLEDGRVILFDSRDVEIGGGRGTPRKRGPKTPTLK